MPVSHQAHVRSTGGFHNRSGEFETEAPDAFQESPEAGTGIDVSPDLHNKDITRNYQRNTTDCRQSRRERAVSWNDLSQEEIRTIETAFQRLKVDLASYDSSILWDSDGSRDPNGQDPLFGFARRVWSILGPAPAFEVLLPIVDQIRAFVGDRSPTLADVMASLADRLEAVRVPLQRPLDLAFERRGHGCLPTEVIALADPQLSELAGLVAVLQALQPERPIVLAQVPIAELFGVSQSRMSQWLKLLRSLGCLERMAAHETGRAAEYRWHGPLPQTEEKLANDDDRISVKERIFANRPDFKEGLDSDTGGNPAVLSGDPAGMERSGTQEAGSVPPAKACRVDGAKGRGPVAHTAQDRGSGPAGRQDEQPVVRAERVPPGPSVGPAVGIAVAVQQAWNQVAGFQRCRQLSPERRRQICQRARDPFWRDHWREALQIASRDRFCQGRNDRGWKANLDWFIRPDTVLQILERHDGGRSDHVLVLPGGYIRVRSQAFRDQLAVEIQGY